MFARHILLLMICIAPLLLRAQLPAKFFDNLRSVAQAQKIIAESPKLGLRLVTLSDDRDTAASLRTFFDRKRGEQFDYEGYHYKVLERDQFFGMRCSYVYLDGDKLTLSQIENIRKQVLAAYKAGTPFADLARQWGMDGNSTGDTDWFREGQMVKDFEDDVRNHKAGDVFLVDVPDKRWYYVVLKTHDDRKIRRVTLVMGQAPE